VNTPTKQLKGAMLAHASSVGRASSSLSGLILVRASCVFLDLARFLTDMTEMVQNPPRRCSG